MRPRWWQWPTVLSLDAPLVSVLWQGLLARVAATPLGWPRVVVLGLSVWLAYAADRWIEGWRLETERVQTPRHRFYQRYRWPVALVWIAALAANVSIAFTFLTRFELTAGFALLGAVAAYLLSHQLVHRHRSWRVPKEICVAALLTAGIGLFLLRSPALADVVLALTMFAMLSFANCALISVWERQVDRAHGSSSLAVDTQANTRAIRQLPWLILVVAVIALAATAGPPRAAAACAAGSAVLLASVDMAEPRLGWQPARVLADVALMTPAIPLLWT